MFTKCIGKKVIVGLRNSVFEGFFAENGEDYIMLVDEDNSQSFIYKDCIEYIKIYNFQQKKETPADISALVFANGINPAQPIASPALERKTSRK